MLITRVASNARLTRLALASLAASSRSFCIASEIPSHLFVRNVRTVDLNDVFTSRLLSHRFFSTDSSYDQKALKCVIHCGGTERVSDQNLEGKYKALEKYENDLAERFRRWSLDFKKYENELAGFARRWKHDPNIGDNEIRRCMQISDDTRILAAEMKKASDMLNLLKLEIEKFPLEKDMDNVSKEGLMKLENYLDSPKQKQNELNDIELKYELVEDKNIRKSGGSSLLPMLTGIHFMDIISKWMGIPLSNLQQLEADNFVMLEQVLQKRVVGQDMTVKSVADTIRRNRTGVADPNRPIANFMFMGPIGMGKTEVAKAIAINLFNTEKAFVRVDMSNYMEKDAVSRLVGAPLGYVGYEEGGQLTEFVRRRPYCVVLFDDIEKAHPDVFNILLHLLDDGTITDSQGRIVRFTNCVVIMTTNIGSSYIIDTLRTTHESKEALVYDILKTEVMDIVAQTFGSEFMYRVDECVVFQPLDTNEIIKIVEIQLHCLKNVLEQRNIHLQYTPEAVELLGKLGFEPNFGARPVKRVIQELVETLVENEIAKGILDGDFAEEDTLFVDSDTSSNRIFIKKL